MDGFVPSPYDLVSAPVRPRDPATQSTRASVLWLAVTTHPSAEWLAGAIGVTTGAGIYHSRPGSRLGRCLYPPGSSDGHTSSADRTTLTVADRDKVFSGV